jgi:flagellar motor switch protein FliM
MNAKSEAVVADAEGQDVNLEVILDVPVTLSMEVGRTRIPIRNLLQLNQGSVVELIARPVSRSTCSSTARSWRTAKSWWSTRSSASASPMS